MKSLTKLNVKVGQQWRCRDGSVATIYRILENIDHPIVALDENKKIRRYNEDGTFTKHGDYHDYDILGFIRDAQDE